MRKTLEDIQESTPNISEVAGIADQKKDPLFRSVDKHHQLTNNPMTRTDELRIIKRRALGRRAPLFDLLSHPPRLREHAYLENGGTIENAQAIENHEAL